MSLELAHDRHSWSRRNLFVEALAAARFVIPFLPLLVYLVSR